MRCQGGEFNVNSVTCLHMDSLDYDAIADGDSRQKPDS